MLAHQISNYIGFSEHTVHAVLLFAILAVILGSILVTFWHVIIVGSFTVLCLAFFLGDKPEVHNPPVYVVGHLVPNNPYDNGSRQ
jgi:hypothetical protein